MSIHTEEPIEVGWYAYTGGAENMVFHLRQSGQWSAHFDNGTAADCAWGYIEQALGVWDLARIDLATHPRAEIDHAGRRTGRAGRGGGGGGAVVKRPKWLRHYLPNTSTALALVSLNDPKPFSAHWPLRLTQLIGGRRWSLSLVWYTTPAPVLTADGEVGPVRTSAVTRKGEGGS